MTEEGLEGGPVIPNHYDGSPASLAQLKVNVQRSGEVGQLVAYDGRSSIVYLPLLSTYADGRPLDYTEISNRLEDLRRQYGSDTVALHITGFAKVVGDLMAGLRSILVFFALAVLITAAVPYGYTRCWRSTLLAQHAAGAACCSWRPARSRRSSGSWGCCRRSATGSTRTRCSCRYSSSPSA